MTRIEVPSSDGRRRSSGRIGRWLIILVLVFVVVGVSWTWLSLAWAYAEGERAGVLQKFVRRGWVCKTQEGEIALYYGGGQYMGSATSPQLWDFSVRDRSVADELNKAVGHRVQLHYTEHPGIPTACFAETRYFVDRVTITDAEPNTPTGAGAGATPSAQSGGQPATPKSQSQPQPQSQSQSQSDSQTGGTLPAPPPPAPNPPNPTSSSKP